MRERALAEKEAAIAAQEREVQQSKKASQELIQSAADMHRIELIAKVPPTALLSGITSDTEAQQESQQRPLLPHVDPSPGDKRNTVTNQISKFSDEVSAIQDLDDDDDDDDDDGGGSPEHIDVHSHHSGTSSMSLEKSEAIKVSSNIISTAAKDLSSPEKLRLVGSTTSPREESRPSPTANNRISTAAVSTFASNRMDNAATTLLKDSKSSTSAKFTSTAALVAPQTQAPASAPVSIKLQPAVIEPEQGEEKKKAGFSSIGRALVGFFGTKKPQPVAAPASAAHEAVKPPSTIPSGKTGSAMSVPALGVTEKEKEQISAALAPAPAALSLPVVAAPEEPRPMTRVTVTDHSEGAPVVAMTPTGPVAVDSSQWQALVTNAASYQPDHHGLAELIKAQTDGEKILDEYRERHRDSKRRRNSPTVPTKSTDSHVDDSEVAHAYLNLVEVHLSQSDIWKNHGDILPAIVHRDHAVRLHLRVQREFPDERLVPTTIHIKRSLFSTTAMLKKSSHRLVASVRSMRSLSDRHLPSTSNDAPEDDSEYTGHEDSTMGPQPFPVEYTIGIYNALMNLANEVNLHWLVEAYYREAMELKYGIPCYLARADIALNAPMTNHPTTRRAMSTYIEDLAALGPETKIKTQELHVEVEAMCSALYDKIHAPAAGDREDTALHLSIRVAKLCEQLAQEYIAGGALLAAVAAREKGYRACQAPAPEFSMRVLGSLGVLSRLAGAKTAAEKYFMEMQTVGAKLTGAKMPLNAASNSIDALDIPKGAVLDLAYYTTHQADLYRTNGYFKKASKLLDSTCKELEAHYGSEYEHPIPAASKCSYHLSLVGSMCHLEAFFDTEAALPPCVGSLDIDIASLSGAGTVDPSQWKGFGGKLSGLMSFRSLFLPRSENAMRNTLYPLKSREETASTDENFSMMDAQQKRSVLSHALYVLDTDPTKILAKKLHEISSRNQVSPQASKRIESLLSELNRQANSPSPDMMRSADYILMEKKQREQKLYVKPPFGVKLTPIWS